jgi:Rap1a immunity proteins
MSTRLLFLMALIVPLALLTSQVKAQGTFLNGNQLLSLCDQDLDGCTHYIGGVADGMIVDMARIQATRQNPTGVYWFCFPLHMTDVEAKDITVKYLREHPQMRQIAASTLVAAALGAAFPCR